MRGAETGRPEGDPTKESPKTAEIHTRLRNALKRDSKGKFVLPSVAASPEGMTSGQLSRVIGEQNRDLVLQSIRALPGFEDYDGTVTLDSNDLDEALNEGSAPTKRQSRPPEARRKRTLVDDEERLIILKRETKASVLNFLSKNSGTPFVKLDIQKNIEGSRSSEAAIKLMEAILQELVQANQINSGRIRTREHRAHFHQAYWVGEIPPWHSESVTKYVK